MSDSPAVPAATVPTATAGPIADLSYRNYDGPLRSYSFRWWIIARSSLRTSVRRWWFWLLAAFAVLPYVIPAFQLFMRSQMPPEMASMAPERSWGSYFYDAYSGSLFWLFLIAMMIGSSSIAGDNRSHALQIYLSKPITKGDYLLGKWAGLFILLYGVALAPALLLYIFTAATFFNNGFGPVALSTLASVVGVSALPAMLHSCLLLGFSAWSKRPLMAGGIYAGLYTGLGVAVSIVALILFAANSNNPQISNTAAHVSLPGILRGLAMHAYNATPTFFGIPMRGPRGVAMEKPDLWPVLLIGVGLCILGVLLARVRIRAVEVVRG